jgi:hypothetical protein
MAGPLEPGLFNVEWLLAVAAELSAVRLPVPAAALLVSAISSDRCAAWAEVMLCAICSGKFETLATVDRERLAQLYAAFKKMAPAENLTCADWYFKAPWTVA